MEAIAPIVSTFILIISFIFYVNRDTLKEVYKEHKLNKKLDKEIKQSKKFS